jgi:hypothetical protein
MRGREPSWRRRGGFGAGGRGGPGGARNRRRGSPSRPPCAGLGGGRPHSGPKDGGGPAMPFGGTLLVLSRRSELRRCRRGGAAPDGSGCGVGAALGQGAPLFLLDAALGQGAPAAALGARRAEKGCAHRLAAAGRCGGGRIHLLDGRCAELHGRAAELPCRLGLGREEEERHGDRLAEGAPPRPGGGGVPRRRPRRWRRWADAAATDGAPPFPCFPASQHRRAVVGAATRGGADAGWRWLGITPNLKEGGGHRDFGGHLQDAAARGKTPSVSCRRRMALPVRVVSLGQVILASDRANLKRWMACDFASWMTSPSKSYLFRIKQFIRGTYNVCTLNPMKTHV